MLGMFRINYLNINWNLVKVYSGVENTSEKNTQNHYTKNIFKDPVDGWGREYISTLEY